MKLSIMYFLGWNKLRKKPRFLLGVGALTVSLGFLIFLNFRFWKILNSQQRSSLPVLSPVSSSFCPFFKSRRSQGRRTVSYNLLRKELVDFRDLFRSMIPIVEEIKGRGGFYLRDMGRKRFMPLPKNLFHLKKK